MEMPKKLKRIVTGKIRSAADVSIGIGVIFVGNIQSPDVIQITRHLNGVSIKVDGSSILYEEMGLFDHWRNGAMINLTKR